MERFSSDCPDNDAVDLYVMNRLAPAATESFEAHLAICPSCPEEVLLARDFIASLRAVASEFKTQPIPINTRLHNTRLRTASD